jgi:hypothetical protein
MERFPSKISVKVESITAVVKEQLRTSCFPRNEKTLNIKEVFSLPPVPENLTMAGRSGVPDIRKIWPTDVR